MHEADHRHVALALPGASPTEAMLSSHPGTGTAIVFVHGFAGNNVSTWAQFQRLVDELALDDAWWRKTDLYFYGYRSVIQSANESARELANFLSRVYPCAEAQFFEAPLTASEKGTLGWPQITSRVRAAPYAYTNLLLVGHSEGGVVIRLAIRNLGRRYERDHKTSPNVSPVHLKELTLRAKAEKWTAEDWVNQVAELASTAAHAPIPALMNASVRLFAPALSGSRATGILGFVWLYSVSCGTRQPYRTTAAAVNG